MNQPGWPLRLINAALAPRGYELRRPPAPNRRARERAAFQAEAEHIRARHRAQTRETVAALARKYERPVLGRVPTWDLIERLAACVDPTDAALGCTSQLVHTLQVVGAMEADGVTDRDLLLAGLLHDVGKLLLLAGEVPEHVACLNEPVGEHEPGIGLDQCVLQWNHDEFAYSRLKEHVPHHVAWLVRYHSIVVEQCEPLMDARDRAYTERYLRSFRAYDQGSKSPYVVPPKRLDDYRGLVAAALPPTLLF